MKKILSFLILSFVLLAGFTGCISKEPEKEEKLKVYANDNIYGAVYVINTKLSEELIEVNSNSLKIIKYEEGKTLISIVNKKGVFKKGEVVFNVKNNTDNLEIQQKESINTEKFKRIIKNVKSDINTLPILLGDFDKDGTVGLTDFITFKTAYGATTYDINYDIAPATKGIENWENIFCNLTADGAVNLFDFVVFANNYGKENPDKETELQYTDVESANKISETGCNYLNDNLNNFGNDLDKAITSLSEWLKKQPEVQETAVTDLGVDVLFKSGVIISLNFYGKDPNETGETDVTETKFNSKIDGKDVRSSNDIKEIKNNKILILADEDHAKYIEKVEKFIENGKVNVVVNKVTKENFSPKFLMDKSNYDYGIIIFMTHGGINTMKTGETVTAENFKSYVKLGMFKGKSIGKTINTTDDKLGMNKSITYKIVNGKPELSLGFQFLFSKSKYIVKSNFIKALNLDLLNTVIVNGSCYSYEYKYSNNPITYKSLFIEAFNSGIYGGSKNSIQQENIVEMISRVVDGVLTGMVNMDYLGKNYFKGENQENWIGAKVNNPTLCFNVESPKDISVFYTTNKDGVVLIWTENKIHFKSIDGYKIYKDTSSITSPTNLIATVETKIGQTTYSYTDKKDIELNKKYFYKIVPFIKTKIRNSDYEYIEYDKTAEITKVTEVSIEEINTDIPTQPMKIISKANLSQPIVLSWSKVNNVLGYKIYRSRSSSGEYLLVGDVTTETFKDSVTFEQILTTVGEKVIFKPIYYYYKIKSYNAKGHSSFSHIHQAPNNTTYEK